jgi:hypothetical protein
MASLWISTALFAWSHNRQVAKSDQACHNAGSAQVREGKGPGAGQQTTSNGQQQLTLQRRQQGDAQDLASSERHSKRSDARVTVDDRNVSRHRSNKPVDCAQKLRPGRAPDGPISLLSDDEDAAPAVVQNDSLPPRRSGRVLLQERQEQALVVRTQCITNGSAVTEPVMAACNSASQVFCLCMCVSACATASGCYIFGTYLRGPTHA